VGSSATLSETLTSSGTSSVTVNSASVSGTGYTVSGATFPVTLSPSQKVTLSVKYAPTKGGAVTGTLSISSTSSSNPTTTVGLSGTGTHAVTLSWQAPGSSSMPVTGYNVYRATGSSSSYQLLSSTASSQLSYLDTNVQSGTAYSYYVESVDSSGVQSSPSNQISVTIPTP
jgi:Abnormal spindle-like microcephaly-assoc'd, ASPM-SPD-2-Hydin/Fibronectin type III domain